MKMAAISLYNAYFVRRLDKIFGGPVYVVISQYK